MTLEEQFVTSLPLALQLKKLGLHLPSLFYWRMSATGHYMLHYREYLKSDEIADAIPAYTAGELGTVLPRAIKFMEREAELEMSKNSSSGSYHVRYHGVIAFNETLEADSRAELAIWLLENDRKLVIGKKK